MWPIFIMGEREGEREREREREREYIADHVMHKKRMSFRFFELLLHPMAEHHWYPLIFVSFHSQFSKTLLILYI